MSTTHLKQNTDILHVGFTNTVVFALQPTQLYLVCLGAKILYSFSSREVFEREPSSSYWNNPFLFRTQWRGGNKQSWKKFLIKYCMRNGDSFRLQQRNA
ncbi:hypothetical protein CEXT_83561 [Caerostris extrusa]|uniref:Uncharacterized protein n=1 Tax=Caerostris extrusa TaxID=172846 RepID=A0AAV4PQV0_CAEEX|nr:hypothetical protein CEXT_83561 [Caerostris extrusa]